MDIIINIVEVLERAKSLPKKVTVVLPDGVIIRDAPPLKVWGYSAGAAFSLLFLFLFYSYSEYGPLAKTLEAGKKNLEAALIENNTGDTAAVSVVILGSSLLESALVDSQELERRITKETKRKTNVLRVALYNVNMDIAERIDFFKFISKYPPQYLFIENLAVNLNDAFWETSTIPVDAAVLHLRNEFRSSIGLPQHENYFAKWCTYDTKPRPESYFYTGNFDSLAFRYFQTKEMFVRKVSDNETANATYEALKGKTKIVFIGMPQSDKLRQNFLNENEIAEFNKVMDSYKQNYQIDYWPYPSVLPDSSFTEGFHVNYRGAEKYEDWFVSRFASMR